jgi:peptide/nickel transport system substrate-binding protein
VERKKAALSGAAFFLFLANAAAAPCGTAVIPTGIGQTDPTPITSISPLLGNSAANLQATLLMFRPLVWIAPDDTEDTARSLAASITPLDGATRMRVVLKPWHWSDGAPVTADDVRFTWERIEKLGGEFAYAGMGGIPDRIADVRAVDPGTVDFVLAKQTNPEWFTLNTLSVIVPLPRHAWGELGADALWRRQTDATLTHVVDGPFRLETLRLDRFASFTPNRLYDGPPAHLARLVLDFLEGGNPLRSLQAGALDMAQVPTALWTKLRATPGFQALKLPEPFGFLALTFNFQNDSVAFFRDARVRRALTMATDQARIVRLVFHGFASENRVPVPVVPPIWLSPAARAGSLAVRYDPAAARAELNAAGYLPGPDGVRVKNGVRLEFTVTASGETPERTLELQSMQQDLRAVGVVLHIRLVSFNQLNATMNAPPSTWQAILLASTLMGMPDGSGNFDQNGSVGGGYNDAEMNRLIAASVDQPGRDALFAYEDYAAAQQPVNILPQGGFALLAADRLGGVARLANPQGFWAPEELWVRDGSCPGAAGRSAGR